MSVVIQNLTKRYGAQLALDRVSFEAKPGRITGFLGPNGAGKSTTMKIASGFLEATSGQILVKGKSVGEYPFHAKKNIGYLAEHNPLYLDMYAREFFEFVGAAYGIRGSQLSKRISEVIDLVGLKSEAHKKIKALSGGYRQRVGIGQALLPDPDVLILDEPTTGLDPNQLLEIRRLIKEISRDKTLIFSTHIMQEVEAICDHVVIISMGKIVADDSLVNLRSRSTQSNVLEVSFEKKVDKQTMANIEGVRHVTENEEGRVFSLFSDDGDIRSRVLRVITSQNLPLEGIKSSGGSLEEIFQKLTK